MTPSSPAFSRRRSWRTSSTEAIREADADAVLAASLFHFRRCRIGEVKAYMAAAGIPVRC